MGPALILCLAVTARAQQVPVSPPLPPAAQDALATQVMLDRAGFSPGQIDAAMDLAQLPALGYRDLLEALAERFHSSPKLLKRLNPGKAFVAGDELLVPNVRDMAALTGQDANK